MILLGREDYMKVHGMEVCTQLLINRVTQGKWDKGKDWGKVLSEDLMENPAKPLSYKRLERIRGFLYYLAMVYDVIFYYLQGFHLTLASYLQQRNDEGWKITNLEWIGHVEIKVERGTYTRERETSCLTEIKMEGLPLLYLLHRSQEFSDTKKSQSNIWNRYSFYNNNKIHFARGYRLQISWRFWIELR